MNKARLKKLLILNLPYVLIGLYATKLGEHGTWLTARTCRESCSTSWTGYPLHFAHRGPALFLQTFCWASPLAA